jgi:2,3-bisphosphoglycerate-independent phosphoglycerate mutase
MKYIIVHADGLTDLSPDESGKKTPLQSAATPHMDRLANAGEFGLVTVPGDTSTGGDVMALALLGYDPRKMYVGPAPFEAAGLGIAVGEHDVVYRCNMVTLANSSATKGSPLDIKKFGPSIMMEDDAAEGMEDEQARELIEAINEQLGSETIQFYPGKHPRHLMVWVGGKTRAVCVDPQDLIGKPVADSLPSGDGSDILRKLMEASLLILGPHPVNDERREAGLKPVNCLWLWGQGRVPQLTSPIVEREMTGAIISTSDVHRGIGICAGLDPVDVDEPVTPGETGFRSRGEAALKELRKKDLVYLHAHVPDDFADGDVKSKVKMIEEFDEKIVGAVLGGLSKALPFRVLLVCGATGARKRTSSRVGPAQALYVLADGPIQPNAKSERFSEAMTQILQTAPRDATKLINRLIPRV